MKREPFYRRGAATSGLLLKLLPCVKRQTLAGVSGFMPLPISGDALTNFHSCPTSQQATFILRIQQHILSTLALRSRLESMFSFLDNIMRHIRKTQLTVAALSVRLTRLTLLICWAPVFERQRFQGIAVLMTFATSTLISDYLTSRI